MNGPRSEREAGGDVDDPGPDRGGPGGRVDAGGQMSRRVGEVVDDRGAGQPGVVGEESAGRQVREGPGDQIGVDLLAPAPSPGWPATLIRGGGVRRRRCGYAVRVILHDSVRRIGQ